MALRLRRDVQKSSYYLWFLGAEEARGLRGPRVINPVLPYLIDRSNEQEPIKVTLQISHKGIKILQGSSKHFIPHSAITSSVQTDDIVACVLLLYNPATKCPLHVHAYRCDSETTAETLHQQLQTLINRPENQKRFEELESRLGVSQANLANLTKVVESKHQTPRRFESSPKRFESSLGSDTGHSTRESECSEEHNVSPLGLAPPALKQNAELFDSLAAELRAKLNGNGPPLLLPPRDYDTVHRSKGNLAAIELRRCRNSLIVGGPTPTTTVQPTAVKQVSSRGSSGIGSDLAPSPERQDTHSSSEDEHWSNEADNSVIALKASQIAIEKKQPLSRKSAMQPPSDNYLRDLPAKPYKSLTRDKDKPVKQNSSWTSKEEEIRPIIMRPSDYDAKFKRILMEKQHDDDGGIKNRHQSNRVKDIGYQLENEHFRKYPDDIRENGRENIREKVRQRQSTEQTPEIVKYNQMEKIFQKKLSLERETSYKMHSCDDFDSDHETGVYRKENLTDKQKFQEFSTKVDKPITDHQKFGRQRYADPKDLPFESVKNSQSYSPGYSRSPTDLNRDREREHERQRSKERNRERSRVRGDGRDPSYSHSNERNPYREPDSIPYMESIEKMMKSPVMRYKSFEEEARDTEIIPRTNLRKSHSKTSDEYEVEREFAYNRKQRNYPEPAVILPKDRFKDAKEKFRAMERARYSPEDIEPSPPMPPRRRTSLEPIENEIRYDDWSDDEPVNRPTRDQRDIRPVRSSREPRDRELRDVHETRDGMVRDTRGYRDTRNAREISEIDSRDIREVRDRDPRDIRDPREIRDIRGGLGDPRDYREGANRNHRDPRDHRDAHEFRETREVRDYRQNDKRQDVIYPPITNSKSLSNLAKGYRHSYAEPALARSGGRVGLAAVNPF